MKRLRSLIAMLLAAMLCFSAIGTAGASVMTPYERYAEPDTYLNGATLILEHTSDYEGWITAQLQTMQESHRINTVNLYALEDFSDAYKTHLFDELVRLGMKAVVRIEAYDAATFAFTGDNVEKVMQAHEAVIAFVSQSGRREQVAYFALNMPVDDEIVQGNLGGVNSQKSKTNQLSYATELVRRMRAETARHGFADAKLYLSVFYGWDNSYQVPSYIPAGADGYFLNNYSYPQGRTLPDASASGEEIINADRLRISMDTFEAQYGDAPLVIECGFHTLEYNNGVMPNQTAGLVRDTATKTKALLAMTEFYQTNYANVHGILYFGYNLYKEEGNPPAVMDWTLVYPSRGTVGAAGAGIGGATPVSDARAALGEVLSLHVAGDGAVFLDCPPVQQIRLSYQAEAPVTIGIYSMGKLKKTVQLPATDGYQSLGIAMTIVEGYDLELRLEEAGALRLEAVEFYELLEAENGQLLGVSKGSVDANASAGVAVSGMVGRANRILLSGTRGGDKLTMTYRAAGNTTLYMETGGKRYRLILPAAEAYTTVTAGATIPANGDVSFYTESDSGFLLDCIKMTGTPAPEVQAEAAPEAVMTAATAPGGFADSPPSAFGPGGVGMGPIVLTACAVAAVMMVAVPVLIRLIRRGKDEP